MAFVTLVQQSAGHLPSVPTAATSSLNLEDAYKVPAVYSLREFVAIGGVMSYGTSITEAHRIVGLYADRILKGEKPTDLPVQQSTKVVLIANFKTAKILGLTVPPQIAAHADEGDRIGAICCGA